MEQFKNGPEKSILLKDLDISVRLYDFLISNFQIRTVEELAKKTESEIRNAKNFNQKHLSEIKEILGSIGLSLKEDIINADLVKV